MTDDDIADDRAPVLTRLEVTDFLGDFARNTASLKSAYLRGHEAEHPSFVLFHAWATVASMGAASARDLWKASNARGGSVALDISAGRVLRSVNDSSRGTQMTLKSIPPIVVGGDWSEEFESLHGSFLDAVDSTLTLGTTLAEALRNAPVSF